MINKKELELMDLEDDRAYFSYLEFTFEVAFDYETENHKAELDYFNGTGLLECTEVSFIDICYISHLYDEDNNSVGYVDARKSDLEDMIKEKLENELN